MGRQETVPVSQSADRQGDERMKIDLNKIPFSVKNSYMAVSALSKEYRLPDAGLYLRTVRGSAERSMVAKLTPLFNGKEEEYKTSLDMTTLILTHGDQNIEFCFADEKTILVRGEAGTEMIVDFMTEKYKNDYIYDIQQKAYTLYMANCYKNNCRYLIWALSNKIALEQEWQGQVAQYSRLRVGSPDGFMFAIQEVNTEWSGKVPKFDFGATKHETQLGFLEFYNTIGPFPLQYRKNVAPAIYLAWSSFVEESGLLASDSMLFSKGWLTDKAGGNLNYAAWVLSYKNPKMAWKQFMAQFAMMDETGRLPDDFNDSFVRWNHVKPPIQGWILSKMMKRMKMDRDQIVEAYLVLSKATRWWLKYRDFRREGLFIYDHPKDSAWNHCTIFDTTPMVASPELQAFLVLQMEVVANLAEELGIENEQKFWKKKSEYYLEKLLERLVRNNLPVAVDCNTGEWIESDCLLPYEFLILGERLPKEVRDASIEVIKSGKFETEYGLTTESPQSPKYDPDSKFRGGIWAVPVLFMADGLDECGEKAMAQEKLTKYLDLVREERFSEHYNSRTGKNAGPTLYTTTACTYLILLHEFRDSL